MIVKTISNCATKLIFALNCHAAAFEIVAGVCYQSHSIFKLFVNYIKLHFFVSPFLCLLCLKLNTRQKRAALRLIGTTDSCQMCRMSC